MASYEARRLENIKRNAALVKDLGLQNHDIIDPRQQRAKPPPQPSVKRRKLETGEPRRVSARIASSSTRPTYDEDALEAGVESPGGRTLRRNNRQPPGASIRKAGGQRRGPKSTRVKLGSPDPLSSPSPSSVGGRPDLESTRVGWTSWTPEAPAPTRDGLGTYHFESHPEFTPNKSPEEIIREGCFGGSYWRPLYSSYLKTTVEGDWQELPDEWTAGLDAERYLTNPDYDAEINKYGVQCGQSIEQWEKAGWINHQYDVRGWFQWYCRFWMGRRCEDDPRQISRWRKCVGETGRWRRILLKNYILHGIRTVFDDGDDDNNDADGGRGEVSPVVHQTCHHWAYEVRQEALDRFWAEGK